MKSIELTGENGEAIMVPVARIVMALDSRRHDVLTQVRLDGREAPLRVRESCAAIKRLVDLTDGPLVGGPETR